MVDKEIKWHVVLSILTAILALLLLAHIVTSSGDLDIDKPSLSEDTYCVDVNADGYYEFCESQVACDSLSATYWAMGNCFDRYAIDYSRDNLITEYDRELFILTLTHWYGRTLPSYVERDPGVYDLNHNGVMDLYDVAIFKELYLWQHDSSI